MCFRKKEVNKIEQKTKALTLLLITVSAAVFAGLVATAFAADTNSTTGTTTANASAAATTTLNATLTQLQFGDIGLIMGEREFGGGIGGSGQGFGGYMGAIEVSSAFNQTITTILGNDSDVKSLITQGYNVTSMRPIVQSAISSDGTVATKATTAIVTMQNGTSGFATVKVDIANAKVSQIVILTRTVIDKTTS
jgi:hypothetical protein